LPGIVSSLVPDPVLIQVDSVGFQSAQADLAVMARGNAPARCRHLWHGRGGGAEVILISTGAEADYREPIDESPAAGFLAKSELSARDISRILDHTP
jgi:hypothetical protein